MSLAVNIDRPGQRFPVIFLPSRSGMPFYTNSFHLEIRIGEVYSTTAFIVLRQATFDIVETLLYFLDRRTRAGIRAIDVRANRRFLLFKK